MSMKSRRIVNWVIIFLTTMFAVVAFGQWLGHICQWSESFTDAVTYIGGAICLLPQIIKLNMLQWENDE